MAKQDVLPKLAFLAASVFLVFLWGFASSHYGWFPHGLLAPALDQAVRKPEYDISQHHIHPARHDLAGVRSYDAGPTAGATLLTGYWADDDGLPGIRLLDAAGATLHHWNANPARIWPTSPYAGTGASGLNVKTNYVHGCHLFPNGDVLFNVEFLGLARLDPAGEVVWRLDRRTHHSVHRDDDGNFWVCGMNWIETEAQQNGRFPRLTRPFAEDLALKVSPTGEVLAELSMLEVVFGSDQLRDLVWRVSQAFTGDILHMNDVEPLSRAMADQYPLFAAGDLVISLRHLDAVFVVDPATRKVKWLAHGPFLSQHDPDFIGDGWVSVFDNHDDGSLDGRYLGGSQLLALRPHTGERKTIYSNAAPASPHERRFYTQMGGKAQQLAGGGWMITESQFARVFEIDAAGKTVWEWVQPRRAEGLTVSEVLEGSRYDLSAEDVSRWKSR